MQISFSNNSPFRNKQLTPAEIEAQAHDRDERRRVIHQQEEMVARRLNEDSNSPCQRVRKPENCAGRDQFCKSSGKTEE